MLGTAAALAGVLFSLQGVQQADPPGAAAPSPPAATTAMAARAMQPPVIDGRGDDPAWRGAVPITAFKDWQPNEGAEPRFRTEARIVYDAANLYVFIRAFDPHPDSIARLLARRDSWPPTDKLAVMVDSYHDRRTAWEFWVNPSGVKNDAAVYNDGEEDTAWDGVWDVATRIDSLGWTAEFRIPLSQLRFGTQREHTFGIAVLRDVYRYQEREAWPQFRQSRAGMVSQFGDLTGLDGLGPPRRLEAAPYVVTKNASRIVDNAFARHSSATVGADFKYRVASNLTLDATVNPDFGQVEADPAVLNLSAFESFFDERRPFFVAGRGQFRFDVNCTAVNDCNTGEGLFYSRRIGRTPQLAGVYGDTTPQQPTTILAAAKLTGRLPRGLTIGALDAWTQPATGPADTTFEPGTNFAVVRAKQDLRHGNSTVGAMLTAVNRSLDRFSSPYLARNAYVGGLDARHRFLKNNYEISGSVAFSRVAGDTAVIAALQTDAVHYYQRPDAGLPLDSTRTALAGDAEAITFAKVGGQHLMFQTTLQRQSPGFEVNDLGYLRRADQQAWSTWAGYFDRHQRKLYNRFQWNNNWWQYWSAGGLPLERAYNTNVNIQFRNNWTVHPGVTIGQLGATYDDRAARGGPAVRQNPYVAPWIGIGGDDRKAVVPMLSVNYFAGDAGHSHSLNLSPELDLKVRSRFNAAVSASWSRNHNDSQWYRNYGTGAATHYTFAHLDQSTVGVTLRLNYTFTPTVSLQVYAQPFVSKGTYSDVRELSADPRAARYEDRYQPYGDTSVTNHPGGFNFKAFNSNVVFRWEYRPGSTLFVVWNQGRQGVVGAQGEGGFGDDLRSLFRLHPMNTVLVKLAYWINP
jgi:Domain of unknown function (DUF5916)/Carbohydrate family 9 binding domain-like